MAVEKLVRQGRSHDGNRRVSPSLHSQLLDVPLMLSFGPAHEEVEGKEVDDAAQLVLKTQSKAEYRVGEVNGE